MSSCFALRFGTNKDVFVFSFVPFLVKLEESSGDSKLLLKLTKKLGVESIGSLAHARTLRVQLSQTTGIFGLFLEERKQEGSEVKI